MVDVATVLGKVVMVMPVSSTPRRCHLHFFPFLIFYDLDENFACDDAQLFSLCGLSHLDSDV